MLEDSSVAGAIPDAIIKGVNQNLRSYQARWMVEVDDHRKAKAPDDVAHRGARQTGKDRSWSFESALDMAFTPKQRWNVLSASLGHSQDFLGDVDQHLDFLEDLTRRAGYSFPKRLKSSAQHIWLDNGSRIDAYAATAKNAQGRRGNIVLNEMGIMPGAALVYETAEAVVRGQRAQGLPAKWRIIGNASIKGSFFHEFWEGGLSSSFRKITTTWEDAFLSWLTEDLGHTAEKAKAWIALQVEDMIGKIGLPAFGQWYRCLWRNPEEGFFDPDLLTARQYDPEDPPDDFPDLDDERVIQSVGYDPGRRRHPAGFAHSLMGRGGRRHYIHNPGRLKKTPWHLQDEELDRRIRQRRTMKVVIDKQGPGDRPAEEAQNRWGGIVHPYPFSSVSRMALINTFLDGLERAITWIPIHTDLRMELEGIQRVYNKVGTESFNIPEEKDNHGDIAVAAFLAEFGLHSPDAAKSQKARRARKPSNVRKALGRLR